MGKKHKSISVSENKLSRLQELVYRYLQCILERTPLFVTHCFGFCLFRKGYSVIQNVTYHSGASSRLVFYEKQF